MTKTEDKNLKYAWLDLETTGSKLPAAVIIEVGIVLTDASLNIIDQSSWILHDDGLLAQADDVVKEMHAANGLAAEVADGLGLIDAEDELIKFLEPYGKKHDFVLAGSGVSHFDRRFLEHYMPKFTKWLRYYNIDVGVLRRSMQLIGREDLLMPFSEEQKPHRALDDAQLHLEELRHIKKALS